jgi:hypothetical protein
MTQRLDCKKKYEKMWERSFQFSWMQGRPWLKYTDRLCFCKRQCCDETRQYVFSLIMSFKE